MLLGRAAHTHSVGRHSPKRLPTADDIDGPATGKAVFHIRQQADKLQVEAALLSSETSDAAQ